jgi:hypothetical protein
MSLRTCSCQAQPRKRSRVQAFAAPGSLAPPRSRWTDVQAHRAQPPHTGALPPPGSATLAARTVRAREDRATVPPLAFAHPACRQRVNEQRPHPDAAQQQDEDHKPAHMLIFPLTAGHAKQVWRYLVSHAPGCCAPADPYGSHRGRYQTDRQRGAALQNTAMASAPRCRPPGTTRGCATGHG